MSEEMRVSTSETSQDLCKKPDPTREHEWLENLLGHWAFEAKCFMGPDQPPMKSGGEESVRSMDGLWVVAEGLCDTPTGEKGQTLMTLGFNPQTGRFQGTWVGSMMTHMWIYNGELNEDETVLTLNAEGPSFTDPNKTASYQDIIEIKSPDHRTLSSQVQTDSGDWMKFMTADYRRKA